MKTKNKQYSLMNNLMPVSIICLFLIQAATGEVIYVDDDANGLDNGTSWANAYKYLQDALQVAQYSDEIWVAEGIYKPDQGGDQTPGDREATFQLINGVALYGGFPSSGDPSWQDRDPNLHETILSGDLNGDDVNVNDPCDLLTEPTRAENSYHVFFHPRGTNLDSSAVIDGFAITGGSADASLPHNNGGGMYNEESSPTVTNCTITWNYASQGAGMYNVYSNPFVNHCRFSNNRAGSEGAGMHNSYSGPEVNYCIFSNNSARICGGGMNNIHSSPSVTNCKFSANSTNFGGGGGMYNYYGNPTVIDCLFTHNESQKNGSGGGMRNFRSSPIVTNCTFNRGFAHGGGGMSNYINSNPMVTTCVFSGNSAVYGAGMHNTDNSPVLTNCTFSRNIGHQGGAMRNTSSKPSIINCTFSGNLAYMGSGMLNSSSRPILTCCTFINNSTDTHGGGMYNYNYSSPILIGCTFRNNSSIHDGGGMGNSNSSPTLTNCIFSRNYADHKGGGIYLEDCSNLILTNCLFWDNAARDGTQIALESNSSADISYSNIEGGQELIHISDVNSSVDWGPDNIDVDPQLTPDGHLQSGSPRMTAGGAEKSITVK